MTMKRLLLTLLAFAILILPCAVWATDYYVKNGGNNALSGLDDDNAWETIAKVNDFAEATGFASGDTINFKRGSTWTSNETLGYDGSVIVWGTINGLTIQDYGDGALPHFNGNTQQPIYINSSTISNLVIKNIDVSGSTASKIAAAAGRIDVWYVNGLTVDGVYYDGHWDSSDYASGGNQNTIRAMHVNGDIEFKNCTLLNMMKSTYAASITAFSSTDVTGFQIWYSVGGLPKLSGTVRVHDNVVHDVYSDCIHTGGIQTPTYIYNNTFYNFGENAWDGKSARYHEAYNNNFHNDGCSYVHPSGSAGPGAVVLHTDADGYWPGYTGGYNKLYNNYIHDINTVGIGVASVSNEIYQNLFENVGLNIYVTYGSNSYIYNNIFNATDPLNSVLSDYYTATNKSIIRVWDVSQTGLKINNNTFYLGGTSDHLYGVAIQGGHASSEFKNNIIYGTSSSASFFPLYWNGTGTAFTATYNNYYNPNHTNRVSWAGTVWDSTEQAAWRALDPAHTNDLFTDPSLSNVGTGLFYSSAADGPVVNTGTALTLTALGLDPSSSWPDGVVTVSRVDNGGTDIGAYEWTTGIDDPVTPGTCNTVAAKTAGGVTAAQFLTKTSAGFYRGFTLATSYTDVCSIKVSLTKNAGSITGKTYRLSQFTKSGTALDLASEQILGTVTGSDAWADTEVTFTMLAPVDLVSGKAIVMYSTAGADSTNVAVWDSDEIGGDANIGDDQYWNSSGTYGTSYGGTLYFKIYQIKSTTPDCTGDAVKSVDTTYNSTQFGYNTATYYKGSILATTYTDVCKIVIKLKYGAGDVSAKTHQLSRFTLSGNNLDVETTLGSTFVGGNDWNGYDKTILIDPPVTLTAGEAIVIYSPSGVDSSNYIKWYHTETGSDANLGDRKYWANTKVYGGVNTQTLDMKIYTATYTTPPADNPTFSDLVYINDIDGTPSVSASAAITTAGTYQLGLKCIDGVVTDEEPFVTCDGRCQFPITLTYGSDSGSINYRQKIEIDSAWYIVIDYVAEAGDRVADISLGTIANTYVLDGNNSAFTLTAPATGGTISVNVPSTADKPFYVGTFSGVDPDTGETVYSNGAYATMTALKAAFTIVDGDHFTIGTVTESGALDMSGDDGTAEAPITITLDGDWTIGGALTIGDYTTIYLMRHNLTFTDDIVLGLGSSIITGQVRGMFHKLLMYSVW